MKYKATLTFEFDTADYEATGSSPEEAKCLVDEMLLANADWPDSVKVEVTPI